MKQQTLAMAEDQGFEQYRKLNSIWIPHRLAHYISAALTYSGPLSQRILSG